MWSVFGSVFLPLAMLAAPTKGYVWQVAVNLQAENAPHSLDEADQARYESLVYELGQRAVADASARDLVAVATSLGLELTLSPDRMVLQPASHEAGAAGVLAIRRGPLPAEVVVAAPHPFTDLDTGRIASRLFDESAIRAVYIATQVPGGHVGSDPAQNDGSTLQLATHALGRALPQPWFVQIHTFAPVGSEPAVVVDGASTRTPRGDLELAADMLCIALGGVDVRSSRFVPRISVRDNAYRAAQKSDQRMLLLAISYELSPTVARTREYSSALGQVLIDLAKPGRVPAVWPPRRFSLPNS